MAPPKLHLDVDASIRALHKALLARGHDVTRTPADWIALDAGDEEQLLASTAQGRCLFTFNVRDLTALARRYQPVWRRLSSNPSRQAKENAKRLSEYLQKAIGQKEWVEPRVVWVGPGKLDIQGKPAVYIWFLEKMATYADELNRLPAGRGNAMQRVRGALGAEGKGQDG